jgi:hypothetical protein
MKSPLYELSGLEADLPGLEGSARILLAQILLIGGDITQAISEAHQAFYLAEQLGDTDAIALIEEVLQKAGNASSR